MGPMATVLQALAIAGEHHRAGRLQAAEEVCRQVLAAEPNEPDAWHLMGLVFSRAGEHDRAVECFERAIALRETEPAFHHNLGNALQAQGELEEAAARTPRAGPN